MLIRYSTMSEVSNQRGVVPLDAMSEIEDGMARAEVIAKLGEPFQRMPVSEVRMPCEAFAVLNYSFRFLSGRYLTEVWSYRHDRRGKFKLKGPMYTILGFEGDVLQTIWRSQHAVE